MSAIRASIGRLRADGWGDGFADVVDKAYKKEVCLSGTKFLVPAQNLDMRRVMSPTGVPGRRTLVIACICAVPVQHVRQRVHHLVGHQLERAAHELPHIKDP